MNILFDLFGVLFHYKGGNTLLNMGALSLYLELGDKKNIFVPIEQGITLLKECKKQGHTCYLLSNIRKKSFDAITSQYPDIFDLFDGVVTSGEAGFAKPDERMFEYLLEKYDLYSYDCLFIDDKKSNVVAAEGLGIRAIHCHDHAYVKQQLQKRNILQWNSFKSLNTPYNLTLTPK